MLQLKTNQPDAAEASIKKVIELNPAATQAHLLLGTFYQSRSRFAEAEQQFHNAMNMDPKEPGTAGCARPPVPGRRKEGRGGGISETSQARLSGQLRGLPHAG